MHLTIRYEHQGDRVVRVGREQRALRRILRLRSKGLGAVRNAKALNDAGKLNPRTGKAWTRGAMQAVLRTAEKREVEAGLG